VTNEFTEEHFNTIGIAFNSKDVEFRGEHIRVQIWDTVGQEEFLSLTKNYYRSCAAVLIVYDVTE